jgi:predicted lipoprotein with Yx(FWY)xxD motif
MTDQRGSGSELRRVRAGFSLAVLIVSAAMLAFALAGPLAGCSSDSSQAPPQKVQAMLQDRLEAMNAGDTQAVAECYATSASLVNYADGGTNLQGSVAIADYFSGVRKDFGMQWTAEGDPIQYDRYVIQRVTNTQLDGPGAGATIHVLELDSNNQIVNEWIVGWIKA